MDEIQYAPEIVPAIKRLIDENRQNGQFLITGSQQWEVMKHLSESLAGRVVIMELDGFSLCEAANAGNTGGWLQAWLKNADRSEAKDFKTLGLPFTPYEHLWRGFLPEAQFLPLNLVPDFHSSYVKTYIQRDVRLIAELGSLETFNQFIKLCAALTAQEINLSELGRDIGVTPQTAGRWLNILKSTFQWIEVPAFHGNLIKRLSSKPKGYISDTGFICNSQAISSPNAIASHPVWGRLFETAVACEIIKQTRNLPTKPNLSHWRSHSGAEIDLLIEWNGAFYPIEIKANSKPQKRVIRGIDIFRESYPNLDVKCGLVVAPSDSFYKLSENICVMPWNAVPDIL